MVTDADLNEGRVYPPLNTIREVSTKLAAHIIEYAYEEGLATTYPEPDDKLEFVRENQFSTDYESFIPITYPWPGVSE
jgi:malate dehydrogenase (oxaloacetate-decarboxylating)(NADP+)